MRAVRLLLLVALVVGAFSGAHAMPIAGGFTQTPRPAVEGERYTDIIQGSRLGAESSSGKAYEIWKPLSYTTQYASPLTSTAMMLVGAALWA